ncbi:MAG: hypothetical protein BWZ10_01743 [candidate division BRC1 bacterium ADurb.BinA364]|nr:MAG: hypothetical protein BWZ10_01743 [candidate division BRC1 bacterium ADurb.BinA364]
MFARVQNGVPQPERFLLAHEMQIGHFGDFAHLGQQMRLVRALQRHFELGMIIEVILDRALAPARDDQNVIQAGVHGFLDDVLHDRRIDDRQHFFWLRLGGGQKTGAHAGGGNDRFAKGGAGARCHNDGNAFRKNGMTTSGV